jgi:hypothetical protein
MTYRGHVENGVVLLDDPVRLPDGTEVSVRPVVGSHPGQSEPSGAADSSSFWQPLSIAELAEQQQVSPAQSLEELAGDWPEDESLDQFLDSLRRDRT